MNPSNIPETGHDDATDGPREVYVLRLFVAGMTQRSTRAVANIRAICEKHFPGAYDLEIVNLYERPGLAAGEQIIAAPTCVKELPLPARRVIGDMSNSSRVLLVLNMPPRP